MDRRRDRAGRRGGRATGALVVCFLLAVPVLLWRGLVALPHEYDDLEARGVPVRLEVTSCGPGQGGDSHHYGCRAQVTFEGRTTHLKVDQDLRPREAPDGTVGAIADPQHAGHVKLPEEVARRAGAGAHGSSIFLAFLSALVAGVLALLLISSRPAPAQAARATASSVEREGPHQQAQRHE